MFKVGDLIRIKNMWMDEGDLAPWLRITQIYKSTDRVEFMVMSGIDLGFEGVFFLSRYKSSDLEVISCQ